MKTVENEGPRRYKTYTIFCENPKNFESMSEITF
jgi:hypothetical protein